MSKIRRINFFGGPACGKSLSAANIRSQLGFYGYSVDLIEEVVKEWAYVQQDPSDSDTFFLQASQIRKEDIRLRSGVDIVVTDSPVVLQYFYGCYHGDPFCESMLYSAREWEKKYKSLNIFLKREESFYKNVGRFQQIEEAKKIDEEIKVLLDDMHVKYVEFSCMDQRGIIDHILSVLKENNNG